MMFNNGLEYWYSNYFILFFFRFLYFVRRRGWFYGNMRYKEIGNLRAFQIDEDKGKGLFFW